MPVKKMEKVLPQEAPEFDGNPEVGVVEVEEEE